MTPMALAVIVLVPLAAFEATSVLPSAAVALTRARVSASRIVALLDAAERPQWDDRQPPATLGREDTVSLATVESGSRVAVVGPSGVGKTTLLMQLGGLIPAPIGVIVGARFFAEDAHLFETSILENLRVARGDIDPSEAVEMLTKVGLGEWIAELPDGVETTLVGGARAVSGGQRRRLLLARALLSAAPALLLDEPTEHLDDASGSELVRRLLDREDDLIDRARIVVLVTHQLPPDTRAGLVINLGVSPPEKSRKNPLRSSISGRTLTSTRERRWSEVDEL